MNDKDLQIEDLVGKEGDKKKKVDGKAKGDRTEKNLCHLLAEHFGEPFTKAPGSGAFTSQIDHLPEHAKKTLTGDICGPENFKWVIECKGGYEDDIHFGALDGNGLSRLDEFIEQTTKDADYCGRKSIICWKRNRKPWLAMLRLEDLTHCDSIATGDMEDNFPYRLYYREWIMVSLEKLLEVTKDEKEFWFSEGK
jgi:hypothetical protein